MLVPEQKRRRQEEEEKALSMLASALSHRVAVCKFHA
jgi:hypothetical protein